MLTDISDVLADPVDGSPLSLDSDSSRLESSSGRYYDVAGPGYATLTVDEVHADRADDDGMVTARETFLSRGHYAPFVEAVTGAVQLALDDAGVADDERPVICEIGAGTGYYLSHTLDDVDGARGVGIDLSVPAAERLATCHPRVGAVVADARHRLPLRDSSVDVITVVFSPSNPEEFARVLRPGGQVVVLTAEAGHLTELREPLGILDVPEGKVEQLVESSSGWFEAVGEPELVEFTMRLDQESIATQTGMSPSARHIPSDLLAERAAQLPDHMSLTARATVTRLRVR
ncbi:methyltransferase domain-containing protein [Corynebacterium sp. P7202]|uniref:Methyltransferase domain-containing protein n=1 Tax=Corynebacterium pygosceleis TaxID=2800406 RepID=A0A9Q4GK06_9CORY|nr:methyltransferase domain-containing protein [Corynebacterium pygosceleis]MCK7637978.1 methyltransferase domain-containing protein [Corynebacterium pygosceleis]MCX7468694.1 methyltransferase domain-containing protein [Corynebacterium pygosceleis]